MRTLCFTVLGLLYGVVLAMLGLGVSAGGHGFYGAPFGFQLASLLSVALFFTDRNLDHRGPVTQQD